MNFNVSELRRAVSNTRAGKSNDRVLIVLNSLTFGYWREELTEFQRQDPHVDYLINPLVQSGHVETQNIEREPHGPRHLYDCCQRASRAAGR